MGQKVRQRLQHNNERDWRRGKTSTTITNTNDDVRDDDDFDNNDDNTEDDVYNIES